MPTPAAPSPTTHAAGAADPTGATGLFLAVGQQGQRIISNDGTTWHHQQLGKEGETYRAAAFGNNAFVSIGSYGGNNIFAASPDGIAWKTSFKDARYSTYARGLAFGQVADAMQFLALGGDPGSVGDSKPFILTSADGAQWSNYTPISGKMILRRAAWGKIANDKGLWVGVGDRGRRSASSDGRLWTDTPGIKAIDTLVDVAFGTPAGTPAGPHAAGRFVGVGLNGLRMTTEDGMKWTDPLRGEEGEHLNAILWAGDRFVALGMGATLLSPDGLRWERHENKDAPLTATFGGSVYGKGVFIGSNWRGRLMRSEDAIEWRQVFKSDYHIEAVTYGASA